MSCRVLVTGATGLLGRAVWRTLSALAVDDADLDVQGWSHSRGDFRKVDLTDADAVQRALADVQPTVIVHCAAIRRPDEIKNDEALAEKLNVHSNAIFCDYLKSTPDALLLYISTDYVFDGTQPPYSEDHPPNAVNKYGEQKIAAEKFILDALPDRSAILRVPILYGPVEYLGEGAVDEVLKAILVAPTNAPLKLDHYHLRYPTHVTDIATAIALLIAHKRLRTANVTGIYQWESSEQMTKYDMAVQMAATFQLPSKHFVANADKPTGGDAANRPHDCRMDTARLKQLGAVINVLFCQGIADLAPHAHRS